MVSEQIPTVALLTQSRKIISQTHRILEIKFWGQGLFIVHGAVWTAGEGH